RCGRGSGIDVVDPEGVFREDAQPLRSLHDPPADGRMGHGRSHQRNRLPRRLHDGIFVRRARQLPVAVSEHELAAQAFKRVGGLRRLIARRKDQNCWLGHARSMLDGRDRCGGEIAAEDRRRDQWSLMPLSLNPWPHRSSSLRTKAANSSGVLLAALMPDFSSLSAMTGSAYMVTTSRWILSMIRRGVPVGATSPIQVEISSSAGIAASTASGLTSGN